MGLAKFRHREIIINQEDAVKFILKQMYRAVFGVISEDIDQELFEEWLKRKNIRFINTKI